MKMKRFTYWNNSQEWHGSKIAEFDMPEGTSLSEVDVLFQEQTGIDPRKRGDIGCQITTDNSIKL